MEALSVPASAPRRDSPSILDDSNDSFEENEENLHYCSSCHVYFFWSRRNSLGSLALYKKAGTWGSFEHTGTGTAAARKERGVLRIWSHQLLSCLLFFKMADVSVKKVKELMAKKEAIEKEIKEFQDVLNSVSYYEKNGMIFVT